MLVNRSVRVRAATLALALVGSVAGLVGCGSEESDPDTAGDTPTASGTPSPSASGPEAPAGTPECAEVWVDGAKLPRTYKGCVEDGTYVVRDVLPCSSGQRMVRYADAFYAVLGGTVHAASSPLDDDRDYQAAVRRCRG